MTGHPNGKGAADRAVSGARPRRAGTAVGMLRVVAAAILAVYALARRDDPSAGEEVFAGAMATAAVLLAMAGVQVRTPRSRRTLVAGLVVDAVAASTVLFLYAGDPGNALFAVTFVVITEGALVAGKSGPLGAWALCSAGYVGSQVWAATIYGTEATPVISLVRVGSSFGVAVLLRALVSRIHRQERRYREVVEDLDAIVWEADPVAGRISFAAGAAERILGYPASRWTEPDAWVRWIHPEDLDRLNRTRAEVAETGRPTQVEYRAVRSDGREVWLRDSLSLVGHPGRGPVLRGLTVDVSERRGAEEAARESERRLFQLLETLPTGVFVLTPDGRTSFVNEVARRLLGRDIDSDVGATELAEAYGTYVRGTDQPYPSERTPIVRALSGERVHVDDMEVRTPERTVPLEVWGAPITDLDGRLVYAIAAFVDVSHRVAAERALAEADLRIELLLWSAAEGIYGMDRDGLVTLVNPTAADMFGFEPDELIGRSMHDAVHHSRPDGTPFPPEECPLGAAIGEGRPMSGEDVLWRRDGTSFPVEFTAAPLVHDGKVTGAVVTIRDVTERHEVDRMKDEFVSMVSHELRTPLTSIRGALGLLEGGLVSPTEPRGREMLHIALSNTDRLVRLINDILDLERMTSGRVVMSLEDVSARDLVVDTVQALEGAAGPAGVTLVADAEDARVRVDRDRIVHTLTNLVGNAIKFSPQGGTVRVAARARPGEVLFSVQDEGRGIPPDQHHRIFERFAQVDASDAREKGGTGLGLSIAQQIVEQHGGGIWVDSEPGHGATFSFTLPAAPTPRPAAAHRGVVRPRKGVARALLVEDDHDLAEMLTALLESHAVDVLHAPTASAAVRLARRFVPDVLVLDIALPGADGFAVVEALRQDPDLRSVPVIVFSGLEIGEEDRERLRLGTTVFLTKTKVTPEQLEHRIAELLGRIVGRPGDAAAEGAGGAGE